MHTGVGICKGHNLNISRKLPKAVKQVMYFLAAGLCLACRQNPDIVSLRSRSESGFQILQFAVSGIFSITDYKPEDVIFIILPVK